jgi:hypothetical protein
MLVYFEPSSMTASGGSPVGSLGLRGEIDMPKKKETTETPDESILVTAAKAIGTAAGKVARLAGASPDSAKSQKVPKLSKKNKGKLPRREKKAAKKSSK